MKRVFIIGGAGFVGSNLIRRLHVRDGAEQIMIYDNLSTPGGWSRVPNDPRITLVEANARDYDRLRTEMRDFKPNVVFHLAANPDLARSVTEPTIDFENGTVLTNNVLEAMRVNNVRRLIYLSGSGVYGDRGETVLNEYASCNPVSTYGASKLASEAMISAYCAMFDLSATVFRPANIVGPRQTHGVGYDFLRKLKADPTKLVILGDGLQSKSYIHIDDVMDAVFNESIPSMRGDFRIFNLASDDTIPVNAIARLACEALGMDPWQVTKEHTGGDRGWKGDVPIVRLDTGRLQTFGWRPKSSSREAVRAALEAMVKEL
jgi:UDP-glucose 4-epimerase